jgi:hypothetical protein
MKLSFILGMSLILCTMFASRPTSAQETGYTPFGAGTCFKNIIPTPAPTQVTLQATLPQCIDHKLVVTGPNGGPIITSPAGPLCTLTLSTDVGLSTSYQPLLAGGVNAIRVCVIGVSSVAEAGSSINMSMGFTTSGDCTHTISTEWNVIPSSTAIAPQTLLFVNQFGDQTALNSWFTVPAGGSLCVLYRDLTLLGAGVSKASVVVRYVDP